MIMVAVLTMMISSSSLFLLFLVLDHFKKLLLSQSGRYLILKISLFLSITPLVYVKTGLWALYDHFFYTNVPIDITFDGKMQALTITSEGNYTNTAYNINRLVFSIWICIALGILVWYLWRYIKFRKFILYSTYDAVDKDAQRLLEKYQKQLNIKRHIRLRMTDVAVTPFTLGSFRPIVVIPQILQVDQQELAIHHELCHIKRNDALITTLRSVAVCLYWFNPLIHMLDNYLETAGEFACDELVTQNMDKEECRAYGMLIVDVALLTPVDSKTHVIPLSDNKNILKERMYHIMKRSKKSSKLAILLSAGMVLCSSFTAFAYDGPQKAIWAEYQAQDALVKNANISLAFSAGNNEKKTPTIIIFDHQFTDKDGNVYNADEPAEHKICDVHSYVDGIFTSHEKHKDGSCVERQYEGKRCSRCGTMILGSLISTTTYTVCPH